MLKHVTRDRFRTDKGSDEAVISELERTGTPPEAITEQRLPDTIPARRRRIPEELGQVVLVLQGGGALGAYQVGAYQALHEAGIEPDWVIGTSIGAINASLIAGNAPEHRLERLREFWSRMQHEPWVELLGAWPLVGPLAMNLATMTQGIPAFFRPNLPAFLGLQLPLGSESAGYYDTSPLARTLSELADFDQINGRKTRLTVGAANVRTSEMRYFDNRDMELDIRHVMASGALPPAFPAVRIDGDLYWDGGILSNTPVEAVFDDNPRKNSVIFAVHIWNPQGPEPDTIWQVMGRQKDIQYSSRAVSHIARQKQIHRLRHVIAELVRRLPEKERMTEAVRELADYGCLTRMHVVRLLAPPFDGEDHTKDIDFSPRGIRRRWEAGYADTSRVLELEPWSGDFDPVEGFILHEARPGVMMTAG
ncbi:patatin-like phospholipase family protein [Microvirga sesbaniae]|uniref:patatin-like phospholipase family protein n=1 Tax=Microvirga sesbaniae TaxID=681392 RepID=UPI0021C70823|nr:patatin-like phospholipase family protein [Microvirga sp. HBU67692]